MTINFLYCWKYDVSLHLVFKLFFCDSSQDYYYIYELCESLRRPGCKKSITFTPGSRVCFQAVLQGLAHCSRIGLVKFC